MNEKTIEERIEALRHELALEHPTASRAQEIDKEILELQSELSPRTQSERITEGEDEPHHIGKKTKEVLIQEIFSLLNTKQPFREPDFDKAVLERWSELASIVGDIQADREVKKIYDYLAQQERHIFEQIKRLAGDST